MEICNNTSHLLTLLVTNPSNLEVKGIGWFQMYKFEADTSWTSMSDGALRALMAFFCSGVRCLTWHEGLTCSSHRSRHTEAGWGKNTAKPAFLIPNSEASDFHSPTTICLAQLISLLQKHCNQHSIVLRSSCDVSSGRGIGSIPWIHQSDNLLKRIGKRHQFKPRYRADGLEDPAWHKEVVSRYVK